jgi:hypothetical protein
MAKIYNLGKSYNLPTGLYESEHALEMCDVQPNGAVTLLTSRYVSYVGFVTGLLFNDNNILRTR